MAENNIENDNQFFLDLIENAKKFLEFDLDQESESDSESNSAPSTGTNPNPCPNLNTNHNHNPKSKLNLKKRFQRAWKTFQEKDMESTNHLEETSNSLKVDAAVETFLTNSFKANNSLKKRCKWWGVVVCLTLFGIILLAGVFCPLFCGKCSTEGVYPSKIVPDSFHDNRDTSKHSVFCDSVTYYLELCERKGKDSICESQRCDNLEVTVNPQGSLTYNYRKYDKLIIVLAMLFVIGVCTALVFFIISMRRTIAAEQEYEKSELDHRNKLIDKYMDAVLDGHRIEVQRYENNMELSRQQKLFLMDIYQKEHEYEWKNVSKNIEIRKAFLDSLLETVKKKYEKSPDNKKGDESISK